MNIYAERIELFWGDLTPEAQKSIEEILGDNGNYDVVPIATIECVD